MASSFGEQFRISTWGESHGGGVGVVIDGCPPLLELDVEKIQYDLDRRRPGQSRLTTQRNEPDAVEILSGVDSGVTTGTPIALLVRNRDQNSGAYDHLRDLYRPSHADWTYAAKYGVRSVAGGGRASARETIGRVAAGAVARQLLARVADIQVLAWVEQIHDIRATVDPSAVHPDDIESQETRCPDLEASGRMSEAIVAARQRGDSLGGMVRLVARNVPAGLGEPVFDKLEADLAKAMLSLPAAKGFESGSGYAGILMTGLEHNDPFVPGPDGTPVTSTNNSGGIQGGISNGAPIELTVAFKPTATIAAEQATVDVHNQPVSLAAKGRHDPCVLPRAVPMVEAMACLVLADHWLRQLAVGSLAT